MGYLREGDSTVRQAVRRSRRSPRTYVAAFVAAVPDDVRRRDARTLLALVHRATGQPAVLWGSSIVGFGSYHDVYATGREGDAAAAGFSPRGTGSGHGVGVPR